MLTPERKKVYTIVAIRHENACLTKKPEIWTLYRENVYYKLPEHSHSYAIKSILRRSFQQTTSAVLVASFAWFSHSAAVWSVRKTSAITNNHTSYYTSKRRFFSFFFLLFSFLLQFSYFQPLLYEYNWFTLWKQSPTCDARIVH